MYLGTDDLLARLFNTGLAENNVKIIDSATGTGAFITALFDDSKLARYILGVLNSKSADFYFRLFNSNTQTSLTELNRLCNLTWEKIWVIELWFPLSEAEYEGDKSK
jgi:hypothetical protein